jgi:hypothetical protein
MPLLYGFIGFKCRPNPNQKIREQAWDFEKVKKEATLCIGS